MTNETTPEVLDVVVIGAGLSGIGAGYRLTERMPDLKYAILERRPSLGGTWDLFRYPGIRSDSDMYTLAYPFEPWQHERAIAAGSDILGYIKHTATKYGIDEHIRYENEVVRGDWSSEDALWTLTVRTPDGEQEVRTRFVYACSGYYSYNEPYKADIPGIDDFGGTVIHPQFWPADLDVTGKRVTVIGSGATAITLVPALADAGADVTMLQRTPSFVLGQPGRDPLNRLLRGRVSDERRHAILRNKNVFLQWGSYQFARRAPKLTTRALRAGVRMSAGMSHMENFTAPYNPWDQRLCVVPDSDLFKVLKKDGAHVVTDTIERVEAGGIRTTSGTFIDADIIVTATGLSLEMLGGAEVFVDGDKVDLSERLAYRGCMLEGVPNVGMCVGYINASWGLRSDLSNRFIARVVEHMKSTGQDIATPTAPPGLERAPLLEMESGYLQRGAALMPRKAKTPPWTMRQDYLAEAREMKNPPVTTDMRYERSGAAGGSIPADGSKTPAMGAR